MITVNFFCIVAAFGIVQAAFGIDVVKPSDLAPPCTLSEIVSLTDGGSLHIKITDRDKHSLIVAFLVDRGSPKQDRKGLYLIDESGTWHRLRRGDHECQILVGYLTAGFKAMEEFQDGADGKAMGEQAKAAFEIRKMTVQECVNRVMQVTTSTARE